MHGLRGSLVTPNAASAGLGIIRLLSLVLCYDIVSLSTFTFFLALVHLRVVIPYSPSVLTFRFSLSRHHHLFPPSHRPSTATMDQSPEPNAAAMHNAQRRRGSVGTSQLFDNIVSTSNCASDPSLGTLEAV